MGLGSSVTTLITGIPADTSYAPAMSGEFLKRLQDLEADWGQVPGRTQQPQVTAIGDSHMGTAIAGELTSSLAELTHLTSAGGHNQHID